LLITPDATSSKSFAWRRKVAPDMEQLWNNCDPGAMRHLIASDGTLTELDNLRFRHHGIARVIKP
jgi:hypothetical protein